MSSLKPSAGYLSPAENYWSSWHKESVGVGMSIGFTLIHLFGRYFHGLTERTSVSQHTHINAQPDTRAQTLWSTPQVVSTKIKNTHPILIKWIRLSAFQPPIYQLAVPKKQLIMLAFNVLALTHSGRPFHACPAQEIMSAVSISQAI